MNIDHSIFAKKIKSIALANQVTDFLKDYGKSEPVQIPFGQSGVQTNSESEYKTSQQNMRNVMTQAISRNRPVLENIEKPLTKDQIRLKFNFEEKTKALVNNLDTFIGRCELHDLTDFKIYPSSGKHWCIECRKIANKRRRETSTNG